MIRDGARKRIRIMMVGLSDTQHNRVTRPTHTSREGRWGGRSALGAIAGMCFQRKARKRGQRKIFFPAYSGSSISRHGLESQPHGIYRRKRGGHSGQFTRIQRRHETRVLVHHAPTDQLQNRRSTGSKYMLGARNTRNCHAESSKIITENSSIGHSKSLNPIAVAALP